jgi:hypothetical protein
VTDGGLIGESDASTPETRAILRRHRAGSPLPERPVDGRGARVANGPRAVMQPQSQETTARRLAILRGGSESFDDLRLISNPECPTRSCASRPYGRPSASNRSPDSAIYVVQHGKWDSESPALAKIDRAAGQYDSPRGCIVARQRQAIAPLEKPIRIDVKFALGYDSKYRQVNTP